MTCNIIVRFIVLYWKVNSIIYCKIRSINYSAVSFQKKTLLFADNIKKSILSFTSIISESQSWCIRKCVCLCSCTDICSTLYIEHLASVQLAGKIIKHRCCHRIYPVKRCSVLFLHLTVGSASILTSPH